MSDYRHAYNLRQINSRHVHGETGTGYEAFDDKGEFECSNCRWFREPDRCHQSDMKERSRQPRHPDGSVKIDPEGCCDYVYRKGIVEPAERKEHEEDYE